MSRTSKHSGAIKTLQFNPFRSELLATAGAKGEVPTSVMYECVAAKGRPAFHFRPQQCRKSVSLGQFSGQGRRFRVS